MQSGIGKCNLSSCTHKKIPSLKVMLPRFETIGPLGPLRFLFHSKKKRKRKKGFHQEKVTPDRKSIVKTFDPKTNNISKNEQVFLRKKSLRPQYVFHIKSKSQFNQRSYHSVNVFSVLEKQKEIYILENKETTFVHYSNYVCRTERV